MVHSFSILTISFRGFLLKISAAKLISKPDSLIAKTDKTRISNAKDYQLHDCHWNRSEMAKNSLNHPEELKN